MKKFGERFFINVISNSIIIAIIAAVIFVSFGGEIKDAIAPSSTSAIYNGNKDNKNISIMVNVYTGTVYLDGMLNTLKEHDVKATFFVGGSWATSNADMLTRMKNEGHEIANHGYFHKDHKKLSYAKNKEEILKCETVVETLTGIKTNLFAPPSGSYGNVALQVAEDLGYRTIMWSKDIIDWRDQDKPTLIKRATKDAKGGDLVLMHPTKSTMEVLEDIIKIFKEKGLNIVTVTQNLA